MRLHPVAFAEAGGLTAAVVFVLCGLYAVVAPWPATDLLRLLFHLDLSAVLVGPTPGSFFGGLVLFTLGSVVVCWILARLYNGLAPKEGPKPPPM
jgi:hypothetical protein